MIINTKLDIKQDAWNWWHACNKTSFGVSWKDRVDEKILLEIIGKNQAEAFVFLIPYLEKLYKEIKIIDKLIEVQEIFKEKEKEIFLRMERVLNKKIYKKEFTCFLTTFPRAPYDYDNGYVWIPIIWPKETYTRCFIHELLHFQTLTYWRDECLRKLPEEEFENLKEALTVILNEEFLDLMVWKDKGYEIHKNFREILLNYWQSDKNFDKLVKYGISYILEHKIIQ